jgi:Ni,Fe-hydrogenase III small subunit/NAD-dependent dihydropyrimidine dehydrogenase PreA subunit
MFANLFNPLKVRINQGKQYIPDIKAATVKAPFRGLPELSESDQYCADCGKCLAVCPVHAVNLNPFSIDMGKCVFCGDCVRECPNSLIHFGNFHKTASTSREYLIVGKAIRPESYEANAIVVRKEIRRLFSRSLKLRQVSAAGCNGCEMELNACGNVNFDMGRFGIDFVASPRHADGLVITGPISENMAPALEDAYQCTPDPKIVILAGACAISGGVFQGSPALNRDFIQNHPIDLYIPGCPVHPLTFINGVRSFLGQP